MDEMMKTSDKWFWYFQDERHKDEDKFGWF